MNANAMLVAVKCILLQELVVAQVFLFDTCKKMEVVEATMSATSSPENCPFPDIERRELRQIFGLLWNIIIEKSLWKPCPGLSLSLFEHDRGGTCP